MSDLFKIAAPGDLTDRELLESIYTMLVARPAKKTPQKATGGAGKPRHQYPDEFQILWQAYPARNGSNPKWQAQQCWNARIKEGEPNEREQMLNGVKRYAEWCEATGKTGTETVMQCTRFLGTGREYENEWTPPATEAIKLPRDNDKMVKFAADRGMQPHIGETFWEFRNRVEDAI